ncbi:TonB-dependent receptor [Pseudomonas sp.]|uniref:TonB-dependent receptor family protein n=1 Tax=Pseudomonas sp. TaxID=306 RepID=UPI0026207C54|nr:TonB-dependent receptor [Pseudomonas sp.]
MGSIHPGSGAVRRKLPLAVAIRAGLLVLFWQANAHGAPANSDSSTAPSLSTVEVTGHAETEVEAAKTRLNKVAGAVSVVDNKEVAKGQAATAQDVLAFQPGVYAQATSGQSAAKVSIRGSGLNSFYGGYALGIKYLYDGIPITGPGGTQEDLLDMAAVDHTEVLSGANAFAYSALTLGGAINMVTNSGYTAPGNSIHLEGGSFGYRKEQLSTGGVVGDSDYYLSVLQNQRNGYQDDSANHGKDVVANFGHVFNSKLETRLIIRYRDEVNTNASTLTKEQIKHDPTANNYRWVRKKPGTTFLGSITTYTFDDDSKLELGLGYHHYTLTDGLHYYANPGQWDSTDLSTSLRYMRENDHLFGLRSDTTLGFSSTVLMPGDVKIRDPNSWAQVERVKFSGSRDTVFTLGNELQLTDRAWLSTGLSLANSQRDVRVAYAVNQNTSSQFPSAVNYDDWNLAPRLGFRYALTSGVQLFGNVSRSIDPPVTWYYSSGPVSNPYIQPLHAQKANTAEIGIRGNQGIFDGSLTFYRSWVQGELLSAVIADATATSNEIVSNTNASPTIHQGVEFGLSTQLWKGVSGDTIKWRQAYTVNDFYYRNDPTFGSNQLPGIPRQVYQAALQYQQASGFYADVNMNYASSYYVDFANTVKAPSYTIFGAKVGYETPSKEWSVFLQGNNLTDQHYVTASKNSYDLKGVDSANFYVGDGIGFTTGVTYRF